MTTRPLTVGTEIGAGGQQVDLAVDPLEGRASSRGWVRAMAMIAVGDPGTPAPPTPDVHAQDGCRAQARGQIDLRSPVADNVPVAEAFGRNTNDVTAIVLDRPRHHDLVELLEVQARASSSSRMAM